MQAIWHLDWGSVFKLGEGIVPSVVEKILRASLIYIFLVAALRVSGKRELAQLSPLDFIVLLAVANAVQNAIIGKDNSITGGIIGAVTLFALNISLGTATYRSKRIRHAVLGNPTELIKDGQVQTQAMRSEQISEDDLLVAVERANASSIDDVESCVLLPSGNFVVRLKPERQRQLLNDIDSKLDRLLEART